MKKSQDIPVKLCVTCDKPLEKKNHESLARYLMKKTHAGLCVRTYMKKNKLGFYGLSTFNPFDYNYEKVRTPREW